MGSWIHAFIILAAVGVAAAVPRAGRTDAASSEALRQAGLRALGATRGYASTALWLRAGDAYRRGDFHETLAAYQLIAELQPRNPAVYSYLAWNQAYNISAPFPEHSQRALWVVRGYDTLLRAQDRMPDEASLRMDEWHFLLDRTVGYPMELLRAGVPRYSDQDAEWAGISELVARADAPSETEQAELDSFLTETGFHFGLYDDVVDEWLQQAHEELNGLSTNVQQALQIAHWCRLQMMILALRPAVEMSPRPLTTDMALILTYRMAWKAARLNELARLGVPENRDTEYVEGVARALRAGIENARRAGGEEAVADFIAHARENLSDVPALAAGLTELNE